MVDCLKGSNGAMLCISCLKTKPKRTPGTGEHPIALAMGGPNNLVIDRVCLDCDNYFGGTADAGLISQVHIEQRRADLGLRGHRGSVPDPKARAKKVPFVNARDPKHRIRQVVDPVTGAAVMRTATSIKFKTTKYLDGTLVEIDHAYIDPADNDKVEMLAKSALRKAGIKDLALLEKMARSFAENLETVEEYGWFHQQIEVRVGGHEQGLLKIAYELAWRWLGEAWLDDPVAIAMRESLHGRKPSRPIRGKIYDDPNVGVIAMGGDPSILHVAFLLPYNGHLLLILRIFDVFTVGFEITATPDRYTIPRKNAIVMHTVQRRFEEVPFAPLTPGGIAWTHDRERSGFS